MSSNYEVDSSLYLPVPAKIIGCRSLTQDEKHFDLELVSKESFIHHPGQFVQLSILGIGEAPISITSAPSQDNKFELCVCSVGDVTSALHRHKVGDTVFVRGPFGHGFDESFFNTVKGKHLILVAGGLGYAPLRSLINLIIKKSDEYEKISILAGWKTPSSRLYVDELDYISTMGDRVELLETVDRPDDQWKGNKGVITTLFPKMQYNVQNAVAIIVGPPIMYKFVIELLMRQGMSPENIYMSLERRMKCGVGKCGHCQMEAVYVCQKGPVFQYSHVLKNEEVF